MLIDQRHRKVEGECEGSVELKNLFCGEKPDIVGENGFRETDELVTMNAAVVLEPLLDTDRDLAAKAMSARVDGSADDA